MEIIEPFGVPDVFATRIGCVEDVGGGCFRFTFIAKQRFSGRDENVVVAKIIAPLDCVPDALITVIRGTGLSTLGDATLEAMSRLH